MTEDTLHILIPVIIALFIFWLLYRIKIRIARIVRNKIVNDFPQIIKQFEDFQQKINYLDVRIERLERKVNELEKPNQP